jgi:phage baseplate assembly protein gpV
MIKFDDGTELTHNSATHKTTLSSVGDVEIISPSHITLTCPAKVTIDSPQTDVKGALNVDGLFTYKAGLKGSGGSGKSAQISGGLQVDGLVFKDHTHAENDGGDTGPAK